MLNTLESLECWLSHLQTQHPQDIHLGLKRVRFVAQAMGLLRDLPVVVTVAGTNGKGSTVAALESIYQYAGYKTGAFFSPHIHRFNERIKIAGKPMEDARIVQAFEAIESVRADIFLSYFEFALLAALLCFQQDRVDVLLLEVGLGGRLDATNIVDSDLAIITSIDFDHQEYLGNTLEDIGREKAGILRKGKPLIYGDSVLLSSVKTIASALDCPIYIREKDFQWSADTGLFSQRGDALYQCHSTLHPHSVACAIQAASLLLDALPLSQQVLQQGIEKAFLQARRQVIAGYPTLVLDVAHNAASVAALAEHCDVIPENARVYAIFSALNDKDLNSLIGPMRARVDYWHFAELQCPRAAERRVMEQAFNASIEQSVQYHPSFTEAFSTVLQDCSPSDWIVIYGSFYTVAQVMKTSAFNHLGEH